jgi:hypothetical protein
MDNWPGWKSQSLENNFMRGGDKMSGQYKIRIFVGIVLGIVIYFVTIWLLPVLGKLKWVFT